MGLVGQVGLMREMRISYRIWLENLNGRDHFEHIDVDGKIILKWVLREIWWKIVGRMYLVHGRDQWWALVNTVMNHCGTS